MTAFRYGGTRIPLRLGGLAGITSELRSARYGKMQYQEDYGGSSYVDPRRNLLVTAITAHDQKTVMTARSFISLKGRTGTGLSLYRRVNPTGVVFSVLLLCCCLLFSLLDDVLVAIRFTSLFHSLWCIVVSSHFFFFNLVRFSSNISVECLLFLSVLFFVIGARLTKKKAKA